MKKRYALASVFTGVAALAAWAIPAGAAPTREAFGGAKSAVLGNVRIDPNNDQIAYVTAQYVCPAQQRAEAARKQRRLQRLAATPPRQHHV